MQEEINELPEDILDLEVDYLGVIADMVNQFGFPIIIALAMGYFIYFVWKFVTEELEPMIDKQQTTLVKLIDQMRMLDQDQIRLQEKLNTVLEYREAQVLKENKSEDSNTK
jgi:F0F1-type ATP synthase membrane subunit b/b'